MSLIEKSDRLAGLSPAKRQLLLKMLQKEAARTEGERAIPRREGDGPAPLSFSQQRLWFLDRLTPGSPAYNISAAVRLRGGLRPEVLRRALNEVARRHEVLRATFADGGDGQPVQIVAPELDLPLPLIDLAGLPDAEGVTYALAREETRRPFDLTRGPLLRALLLRRAADDHVVLFTLHHIVSDGWSMGILTREVAALYRAFAAGLPSPLPELPLQFTDYAAWQREWLRGEVLEAQLAYWRGKLAGAPAVLELPTDRPRPSLPSFWGASRDRVIHLPADLGALTRGGEATLFMVLLAAFEALLGRHSRQDDVLVGSPVANRNRPGLESLIGFFANTLVMRCRLDGDPTFRQLLDRARETTLGAHEHQDLPFERLVDELGLERSLSHSPLFQVVLSFQNAPEADAGPADGLAMSTLPVESSTAKFDLLLGVGELGGDRLATTIEYRTDLFDAATVDRLLGHLETLLAAVAADPQVRVWEVPLLDEAERGQLLEWGGARESYPLTGSLGGRFAERAAAAPGAVAVTFEGESLSYGELDRRANRLANRLLESGVVPGSRVCLALERGLGLIEGILGILKAGCAYVPIDPSYPKERLAWVLEDAGAAALVTEAGQIEALPPWTGRTLLLGETGGSGEDPRVAVAPEWPAYVIYTSGSTGRPKGVVVSHGNVLRLMESTDGWFGFGPGDVWTLFHSYAFDFSVWEIWGALLYGGRLVVVPYLVSRSPEAMLELLDREGVTVLNQTPSAFQALQQVEAERPEPAARSLRWIVFGGEALEPRGLETWWRRHGGEAGPGLVNMYGITETTVHVTWRLLGEAEILGIGGAGGSVIGVPLRDLAVHVLDPWGEPAPVGVAGEVHVGGPGVALGYLGRPELTAERFVPDRFGGTRGGTGARLYRSGDLARWRGSGELEYLGRIDHQVKVRGFRIELGEIESALLQQPGVAAAVVLVREDRPGDRRLVAYVVGREEAAPGVEELRGRLQERLTEYMVPSAFVLLDALPLTPNGKVDRKALPAPGGDRPELGAEYVAPRTPVEEVLAAVWSQVLGIERIGVRDSFFALGGDSILSLRVVALAGERGLEMTLQDLFQRQTIAELGESIRRRQGPAETLRSEPFDLLAPEDRAKLPAGIEDAYPLAALQAGMLYHMELTPEDPQYQNVDSWQLRGRFEREPFAEAIRRVVARHPILRTSFAMTGFSEPLQLVHREAELPLAVEDIRHLDLAGQDAVIDRLVAAEKRRGFDLTVAPQIRFHVFLRSAETFQFTLTENHAIFDGWSLNSTLAEIFELYFELLEGRATEPAPPLSLTYREYVRLEREALASPESDGYWRRLLSEAEPVELPLWPAEWRAGSRRTGTQEIAVPPAVLGGLQGLARRAAVPLKSVFLAAHCKVLSLLAGRPDVVGGLVMNGRLEETEGDQVRGLFLNTLPLRLRLPEGSWTDLVRAAFRAEQEMLPHRRYPFSALQRQWGTRPLYEIAFNYIHFHVVDALLGSGRLEVLDFRRVEPTNLGIHLVFSRSSEGGIAAQMDFDARRFAPAQMRLMAGYYERALAAMAADADAPHGALLAPAERQAALVEWSDTGAARPRGALLHELVSASGSVSFGGETLDGAGLAARSNRLARRLRALGVGPEARVAICLERTPELVVALLAVLKAGGAYVPLDPAHPAERTAMVLEDAGAAVLLTEERWLDSLPAPGAAVLCVDRDGEAIAAESPEPLPPSGADEENLAYVIFTSGSTGRPKGVQLPHRAVVNFLLAMAGRPGISASDVVPALTTITFDIAGLEIWLPLLAGGRVEMVGREEATDGARLAARLDACGATLVQATPATWRLLIDSGWTGDPRLTALCGGEALPRELAETLRSRVGALWNVYGPTETAVWSSAGQVREGDGPVPLGPPIANTRFYVVDRAGGQVPVGVPGEIWIGGDGLARGYLGRPDLTAERFAPDPFAAEPGVRVYRTGDLVRYRPEGELEFLGRIDFQVKVRGYRIELGEIEAALTRHPGVAQAVVVARDDGAGQRLIAYWTGEAVATADLRAFLQRGLPEYMIPSAFVHLDTFPLTPSGKVDRKALPAPASPADAERYVAPEGPVEELLAGIWAEVLRAGRVGVEESFFDLGGHSLLATQVMSRIRGAFGAELPLQKLFEAPTIRTLARAVEAARRAEGERPLPPIVQVSRDLPLPLSFAQERIWFLQRLDPGLTAYNLSTAVRLRGPLDAAALERCLTWLVESHESLRTRFPEIDGRPAQVVLPAGPFPLERIDLRGESPAEREERVRDLAAAWGNRRLDLGRDRLFQGALVELDDEEHILFLLLHHVIADGWSMRLLVRELAALYAGEELPELPIQYADFAVWQRGWLTGEELEGQLGYWRRHLAGAPPLLELPTDRPRPAVQTFRGARHSLLLGAEAAGGIREFGRRRGLTPFMTLLSAFEALLWRMTGADDLVVGVPVANRNRSEIEGLIGTFVNMLAVRTSIGEGESAAALAAAVRDAALGAFAHQDLPFEKLVDELRPERSLSYSPLFQVMLNLQNQPMQRLEIEGLSFVPVRTDPDQVQVDLGLVLSESLDGQAWEATFEYNRDLFEAATVERLANHFAALLAGLLADPGRPLSDLPMLSEGERRQLLEDWNDTKAERPQGALIHELVSPSGTVSFGDETLSGAGLAARSNRLARRLRALGVGPEARVAVCLERTPELVVALLAVLKAGGAYVPLDPAHPAERIAMVLEDAGAAVLLTEERWLASLPARGGAVLCVDRDGEAIAAESPEPLPSSGVDEENLAYVIFTSGSTGRPKGVQLPHRAVVNFLLAMAGRPGISASNVVPALTTITFDIAGLEIWLPLLAGGRVEMVGREEATDGARLAARLAACGATLVQATPATWRLLIDSGWTGDPHLRALCGGEALPRDLAEALRSRVGALWNVYGPTETAVWSSAGQVGEGDGPVPLGPPIANTRFYVVDRAGGPVPVGVPGELWIGGDGLARGYLGRPDLTAERFAPDPFAAEPGARVYRTGDLVRYRPEGELEFLGRIDFQVKVRGYRIELGEIEAALARHPGVAQAVVAAGDDGAGQRLVAYWTGEAVAAPELRAFLQRGLPEYMIPSAFVPLTAFPLTPSGKVDRKALPAPTSPADAERYVAPEGPVEELLAGIWAEVLRVERVGAEDGFFDLGGHSLLATQVLSRIRGAFGVELPLQKLFEAPTIRTLSRAVEAAREEREGLRLPPLVPLPREQGREGLPLSFSQERMWFLQQIDPASTAYNLPFAVRLRGPLDAAALERSFDALAARHETLRTVFRLAGGDPVQAVLPPGPFPLARFDLRSMPEREREAELERVAGAEGSRPFDLTAGPLLRAALVALGEEDHALVLVIHHIVSDGWSWRVLIRELARLYHAFAGGEAPDLPPLPIQYADFAVWQRRVLSGDLLEAELGWWRSRLGGSPPALLLPADRRRSAGQGFQMVAVAESLPPELVRGLKALARRESASLYMTMLAGWDALLTRATAQEDLLLGAPIANRNRVETEGLIGFFLNTLMLRTDTSGDPAFRELVGRARETALGAFAHQDLPLEAVLQGVGWERDGRTAPFQVMFLMQNLPQQDLVVRGLAFSTFSAEHQGADLGNAMFEVGLTLTELADESVSASFTYNGRLFDESTMVRLLERYGRLLAAAVDDSGRRLWEIDLLSAGERAEILSQGRARQEVPFTPVHRRVAAQAARAPEAPAVIQGGAALSYGELDQRVQRLARHLMGLGIGPESVVGVALERSPDLVVALLAVLAAGAAYVPLDPAYPAERLAYILEDAGAAVLISTAGVLERLPGLAERVPRIVDLAAGGAAVAVDPSEPLEVPVAPESLAYLIYTSGSTGKPKGVMVPHGALANYVDAFRDEQTLSPADRVLQFASISFDTSAEEIYPCLTAGAALALRDDAMLGSAEDFLQACAGLGITLLDLPTAFWHGLVDRLSGSATPLPESLRVVIIGGERALPERVAAWRELAPARTRLFNTYGPTETTIVATRSDLSSGPFDPAAEVPIGGPVRNAEAWVLDPALDIAPPGFPGELWVGGAGVARGYAGRPDLTAERFLPDPFSGRPGDRLYRTGDLVRRTASGELEFLGRIDQQVKIRGFRVELREVEAALAEHPSVAEAVVAAREDRPGDRRLVAYVIPRPGEATPAQELRSFLAGRLPDFMVPAAFVTLEKLPLTPSGKVDRRALPAPGGQERGTEDYVAPRTDSEEILAGIWRDLLGVERVGATDDFFTLGGHSLLLPQLLYRLRSAFQVEVPLRLIFDEPTLEGMALTLEELLLAEIEKEELAGGPSAPRSLVELNPTGPGSLPPFFCVHPVGGDVLGFVALARLLGPDQPFYGLRAPGLEDDRDPLASIEAMAEEYLAEIREIQPAGPYRLGGWSLGGLVAFEMAQRLRAEGEEVDLLVVIDTGPGIPEGVATDPSLEDEADPSRQLLVAAGYFQGLRGVDLGLTLADLAGRPAGEQVRLFAERLRRSGLMHSEDTVGQVERFLRVYRAGVRAYRAYRPRPYPGPLTVIRAALQPGALPADLGWSAVAGSPDLQEVPGNHVTMFAEPNVEALAEALRSRLARTPAARFSSRPAP